MAGTKTIDELINQSQEPMDTSKSIDDIINSSNIVQFLSSTMADKTNVDTPYNLKPDITKYSSDDPIDLLFKMRDNERKRPMTLNELFRILEEAKAQKPVTS
jgi:F420-0:gamma-glutamyl ligase-like protein